MDFPGWIFKRNLEQEDTEESGSTGKLVRSNTTPLMWLDLLPEFRFLPKINRKNIIKDLLLWLI